MHYITIRKNKLRTPTQFTLHQLASPNLYRSRTFWRLTLWTLNRTSGWAGAIFPQLWYMIMTYLSDTNILLRNRYYNVLQKQRTLSRFLCQVTAYTAFSSWEEKTAERQSEEISVTTRTEVGLSDETRWRRKLWITIVTRFAVIKNVVLIIIKLIAFAVNTLSCRIYDTTATLVQRWTAMYANNTFQIPLIITMIVNRTMFIVLSSVEKTLRKFTQVTWMNVASASWLATFISQLQA